MGQCIGNCIRCTLVSDEEKMTCCAFQTLRQTIEVRSQLRQILEKIEESMAVPELPKSLMDLCDAESPEAEGIQEPTDSKKKKR